MFVKKIVFYISLLLLPSSVFAQGSILTLERAIEEVLAQNPEIQAARYHSEAAKARIPQAKALEDPMVGVQFYDVPINTFDVNRGMEINYQAEQKIPFPGKRTVRGKAARHDANAVEEGSRGQIQDILKDLKETYYEIYRLDRSLEVNHDTQRLLKQFLGSAETWYATGKTTADVPLKAQVELSKSQNEEIQLDQEKITHLSHLRAILNRRSHEHDEEIRLPSELKWPHLKASLEEIESAAFESRPELKSMEEQKKRDKAKLTAARQGLIPDFSLGFMYDQRPGQQDAWSGTALINLPIFFWGKNRGMIREAKATYKATDAEYTAMQLHTRHEIDQAYSAVKAAEQQITSYQKGILPQAKTTLEAARLAYAATKVDFMTLIDAARTYKDLQMSYFSTQARLGMSFAQLERLVGKNLGGL